MLTAALNQGLGVLGASLAAVRRRQVVEACVTYRSWSDDQLRRECRRRLAGEADGSKRPALPAASLKDRLISRLLERGARTRHYTEDILALALAVECFARAPADLPAGSVLYPEQVAAAWALTGHNLVQMDTGEGKTYAILPTAFTLACSHERVYIVCANDYLAWRDASRTRAFWSFVGAPPGLGLPDGPDSEWSRRVVYTTLSALLVKTLNDELSTFPPSHPVIFGAVVLDEADSILLDQAHQPYTIVRPVKSQAFEWTFALDYARGLVEDVDIRVDRADLSATLTVEGSEKLRARLTAEGAQSGRVLLARYAVELAYIATRVVAEGHDYVVEAGGVHAVDRISGRVSRTMVPDWIIPLELARGMPARPKTVSLHRGSPLVFLERFAHLSGTSGTILDDALEYMLAHRLLCVSIPPRFPRRGELEGDVFFANQKAAHAWVCRDTRSALEAGRPVLIGTQSIAEAETLHQLMQEQPDGPPGVHLLTGLNERDAAGLFAEAGTVGSVLIATQFAGRGIDIRLSEEARKNGGMALICVGHSVDARHDRQFLGRVGRHGDPFSAVFVSSLDDRLMRMLTAQTLQSMINALGGDEPLEGALVQRALRLGQTRMQRHVFLGRRYAMYRSETDARIWAGVRSWFEYLQMAEADPGVGWRPDQLAEEFIGHTVDHFIENNLASLLIEGKEIGRDGAEQIVQVVKTSLGLEDEPGPLSSLDIEGHVGEKAREILRPKIREALRRPIDESARQVEARRAEAHRGWRLAAIDDTFRRLIDGEIADVAEVEGELSTGSWLDPDLDLEALRARVRELGGALVAADPGGRGPLVEGLSRLRDEVAKRSARVRGREALAGRTVRQIAYWSLLLEWTDFLAESERIEHRARQQGYSPLEFHRILTDRILEQWAKNEAAISRRILFNLFRADRPERLDELFALEDNRVMALPESRPDRYEWVPAASVDDSPRSESRAAESMVRGFVATVEHEVRRPLTPSGLTRVLTDFLRRHPVHDLQTPDRIQQALRSWIDEEVERGIGRGRRETDLAWLRRFLLNLRERRIIGPLPTLRHRARLAARRYLESLSEPRTQAVVGGCAIFAALFIVVARLGTVVTPPALGPWAAYGDALIFGGMLGTGNVLAAAMGPVIVGAAAVALLAPTGARPLSGNGWDRIVVPIVQAAVAGWLSSRAGDLPHAIGLFVLMLGLATVTRLIVWSAQNHTSIDLDLPWLGYCVLFVFLGRAAGPGGLTAALAAVAALTLAFVAWQSLNVAEINVVSARVSGTALGESEEVGTSWRIGAATGAGPAVLGTFAVWVAAAGAVPSALDDRWTGDAAMLAVYFAVVAGWTAIVVRRRLALPLWLQQLNSWRQVVVDAPDPPALERKLAGVRRRLLGREMVFLLACAGLTVWVFGGQSLPSTRVPLGLVLVAAATLLATIGKEFTLQVYGFMFSRIPLRQRTLDVSALPEPEEDLTLWERVEKRLGKRLSLTVTVLVAAYGAVKQVVGAIDLWGKVSALWSKATLLVWP
jgi:preprotein translocase subunit SecA